MLLARPARFELTTSAFGELCFIRLNPIFRGFADQFDTERNENITRLRGHSADAGQCCRQPPAGNRGGDGRRRAPVSLRSSRGIRPPATDRYRLA